MLFMKTGVVGKGMALLMAILMIAGVPAAAADRPKAEEPQKPVVPPVSPEQPKASEKSRGSTIEGDILAVGGKGPAGTVRVTAIHLESARSFDAISDSSGHFRISDIPHGYYELAFAVWDKLHVGTVPVVVGPNARLKINVTLLDRSPYSETGEPVMIPVIDKPANALAEVHGKYEKPWYKTKTGVATIIGASIAGLLILTH